MPNTGVTRLNRRRLTAQDQLIKLINIITIEDQEPRECRERGSGRWFAALFKGALLRPYIGSWAREGESKLCRPLLLTYAYLCGTDIEGCSVTTNAI